MTPRRSPLFTRRRVLTGLGVGLISAGVSETGAFDSAEAPRTTTIQAADDQKAILTLQEFKKSETETYDSPHEVKVTNKTGTTLSDNTVSSTGKLKFRQGSKGPDSELSLGELPKGKSQTFKIVTASGDTDEVTLSYASNEKISIEVTRSITVSSTPGGLVYVVGDEIRVYDAVEDEELSPPNSADADVIGSSAADFTAGNNADIAFASTSTDEAGMYSTEVYADGENEIKRGSPSDHDIKKDNTRFALAEEWPGLDGDTGVDSNEYVILYASEDKDIYAMNADGKTEKIKSPSDGAVGVAGVADIDDDDEKDIVFLGADETLRYLNEDGTTGEREVRIDNSEGPTGFGPPASIENFSNVQVPFIDPYSRPTLVDFEGNYIPLTESGVAKKEATCALFDVNDDDGLEFVFIHSDGHIAYVDDDDDENSSTTVKKLEIGGVDDNTRTPDVSAGLNSGPQPNS